MSESKEQPTPTPWRVGSEPDKHDSIYIVSENGAVMIAEMNQLERHGLHKPESAEANADFIVRAANDYHSDKEALRGVAIMLNTELAKYENEPWAQRVRAALANKES